jgi:hypothetical protein
LKVLESILKRYFFALERKSANKNPLAQVLSESATCVFIILWKSPDFHETNI